MKWLFVGLGNPGKQYDNTPHNLGFEVLDLILKRQGMQWQEAKKFQAFAASGTAGESKLYFLKPMTYMNLSGLSVRPTAEYYDIPPENVVVFCDDIHLPFGKFRIRKKGSHGGQNGLRNIIEQFSSDEFPRVRLGCQPKHPVGNMADYVLGKMGKEKRLIADQVIDQAADCMELIVAEGLDKAMMTYNGWTAPAAV